MTPMELDPDLCYQALKTHDTRFDGRFFVGVATTRIYCRPVCAVRTPQRRNCSFYLSAAAAEAAGYRPCLRCRPELAPGYSAIEANARLAQAAGSLIEDGFLNDGGVDRLGARLGVSDRHLRRVFLAEFGVTPTAYAQTQRLLLAKRLLSDTALPVTQVALASGFSSLRRFNALFRSRYRLSPSALRKAAGEGGSDVLTFQLGFRPPLDWARLIGFLAARAVPGVEAVEAQRYRRALRVYHDEQEYRGWIEVRRAPRRVALEARLGASLMRVIPQVLARVKRLFDLACHPDEVHSALGALAASRPGLRLPGAVDGFELAVRAILGQQVSVRAARTLAAHLVRAMGDQVTTPFADIRSLFPAAVRIAHTDAEEIARLGIVGQRARTIVALAHAVASGEVSLEPGADPAATIARLQQIAGIGPWTAQYIAMRALAWPDAFPDGDVGVMKALRERNAERVRALAAAWRPWRAYAVMHLWSSLEERE